MYSRLALVKPCLDEKGSVFISIDDSEFSQLNELTGTIFGKQNFLATIIWQKVHTRKNSARFFSVSHDYILAYAKNKVK